MTYLKDDKKNKKIRVIDIIKMKNTRKLVSLTCYDATFARILEKCDVDLVLVGDSLGHVVQGAHSTLKVELSDMLYHTKCVAAAITSPLLVCDMPFGYAGFDPLATLNAACAMIRAGAEAVKIEGASTEIRQTIETLVNNGIPVMGHIGLIPQSVHALSGYKIQGKDKPNQERLLAEALALQKAGCFALVLELVIPEIAETISKSLDIPCIGIGAGPNCDGQILVLHDMLGLNTSFKPKFLKFFSNLEKQVIDAVQLYSHEVQTGSFPE